MSAGGAAAAAAAEAERQRQEEEEMTKYTDADLQGDWEFKIVRSNLAGFKNPEFFQQVCAEEAGPVGPWWRSSIINACGSSVLFPHGPVMLAWVLIPTARRSELHREPSWQSSWPVRYWSLLQFPCS